MIIYGNKSVHVKSLELKSKTCEQCNTPRTMSLHLFSRHAHVFWIPTFPLGKKGYIQCEHCKSVLESDEMPDTIKREYDLFKRDAKTPIWQFSGLALIAILAVFITYNIQQNNENRLLYIANPIEGDVYKYKTDNQMYSSLKISNVSKDSVFVLQNQFETDKRKGVYKIDKEENYAQSNYGISKEAINNMFNEGIIYDVKRP